MKAIFFTVLALATSIIASPIVERQTDAQGAELDSLTEQIKTYTGAINKTIAGLPDSPTSAQQDAAAAALAPNFQGITDALNTATAKLIQTSKRDLFTRGGPPDLLFKVKVLVWELLFTVKVVLIKLGLGKVLFYLTPLIVSLSGLVHALDKVVDGLLIAVKALLDNILGALAGDLLALL